MLQIVIHSLIGSESEEKADLSMKKVPLCVSLRNILYLSFQIALKALICLCWSLNTPLHNHAF